jgi:hypothetical protein
MLDGRRGFKPGKTGKPTKTVIDRYRYPAQDVESRAGAELWGPDGSRFCTATAVDRETRTIDVEKGPSRADLHPVTLFEHSAYSSDVMQRAVMQMAQRALAGDTHGCGFDLLHRRAPRLLSTAFAPRPDETSVDFAVRIVTDLDRTTLPIQGPPGAGKTYAGARMIRALVMAGRRVGVTAVSHKVIANLLEEVERQAAEAGEPVRPRTTARASPGSRATNGRAQRSARTTSTCSAARPSYGRVPSSRRPSTCCSSTRPARCRSPTSSRSRRQPTASCCSAIRSSSSSRRKPRILTASTSRRCST